MIRAICKIIFLLSLALFLPRFLLLYAPSYYSLVGKFHSFDSGKVRLGVESFSAYLKSAKNNDLGKKILLVTNQMQDATSNTYLQFLGGSGVVPDTVCQLNDSYVFTKLNYDFIDDKFVKRPKEILHSISKRAVIDADKVVLDLQNSGLCLDEAISELVQIMELCDTCGRQLIILDRPNPLGGLVEGPLVKVQCRKFVKLPFRYGMSLGEVASYINEQCFENKVNLVIIPLKRYLRTKIAEFDKLQKIYTAGLFDILNGTCPVDIKSDCRSNFQCFALPEYLNFPINKWYELRAALRKYNIDVSLCRYFNRRIKQYFVGVRLLISDIDRVPYIKVAQIILHFMHEANIKIKQTSQLNRIFGNRGAGEFTSGILSRDMVEDINLDLKDFYSDVQSHFIYRPWPIKALL